MTLDKHAWLAGGDGSSCRPLRGLLSVTRAAAGGGVGNVSLADGHALGTGAFRSDMPCEYRIGLG